MGVCWIVLQTVINDWLMNMVDKVYDKMIDFNWERGWNMRGECLWDDMIPVAMALGAIFSLIVVGRMAYKAMALEEGIDFMKLWKPVAMVFVISNWYVITYSIFSLTQPIEVYFREGFITQNQKIVALQQQRIAAVTKFDEMTRTKEAEAMAGEVIERVAMTRTDVVNEETGQVMSEEEMNDILISAFGESYYDIETPLDSEGNELEKFDATTETRIVSAQNKLERFILWIAEAIWACAVIVLFLVRAFFISVLVMFGPIYMAVSILPAWEDAWQEWIERYIGVCFLGAAAFLGLIFASHIIIWGVKTDVLNWQDFSSSEAAWYEWFAHVLHVFCGSIGLYLVALLTGNGILGASFELATFFFPSKMVRGAAEMFGGLWGYAQLGANKTIKKAGVETKEAGRKVAGNVQAHYIEKNEDKARESLNMGASMGPEGKMKDGKTTGEFKNRTNTLQDHQDSSSARQSKDTYAAHRWADRLWQQKLAGTRHADRLKSKDRMAAARQDLEEFLKAQREGRAEQFLQEHRDRMLDNRILLNIVASGRVSLHLFGGSAEKRDSFLKRHGLYEAFKRAEKLEKKADKMTDKDMKNVRKKKVFEASEGTAGRIFDLISTSAAEILAARGIVLDFSVFDDIEDAESREAIIEDLAGEPLAWDTEPGDFGREKTRRAWEKFMNADEGTDNADGTYRIRQGDEGYENVQQQMQDSWFRKLSADRYNRVLLMQTLQAYEQAVSEGRGEQFIRDMQNFGFWGRKDMDDVDEMAHPFSDVHMEWDEYRGMWDSLRDTDKLRRINEALDAIEQANERHENEDDNS